MEPIPVIDDTAPMVIEPERLPPEQLPPGEWLRKRLFNTWYNSLLTVVLGAGIAFLAWRLFRFVFITARWSPVEENLTLFMVGLFPRDELWRLVAQILLWSAAVGVAWGAAVAGAKLRAARQGLEYKTDSTLATVRRYWPLLLLLVILLAATKTFGPLLVVLASGAVAFASYWVISRLPGEYATYMWAAVGLLGVVGFQIVSGFKGSGWIWLAAPLIVASSKYVSLLDMDPRRQRRLQLGAAIGLLAVAFGVYQILPDDGVGWDKWEGLHLSLIAAALAIVLSFPLGLLLALARRSTFPALRVMATAYIEFFRGVPLISLLLTAQFFIGFFINTDTPLSLFTRAIIAMTIFTAAYVAEIVRGGLQAVPKGQTEAGQSVGLPAFTTTRLIVLPQALRAVIPAMVGQFISLFKDTSLLIIIAKTEFLGVRDLVHTQTEFRGFGIAETLVFVMLGYWAVSLTMSRESQRLERKLGVGER